ncbi:MAG: signal peptidase II [Ignavibacteriales bacterium]
MRFEYLFVLIVITDQITKFLAKSYLDLYSSIPVIPNVLYWTYVKNEGAAFGLFPGMTIVFAISALIVLGGVLWYFKNNDPSPSLAVPLVLASAGAAGNLIDRVIYHSVIDFIDVKIWPVFNIADMAIVFGSILLLFYLIFPDWMGECEFWRN